MRRCDHEAHSSPGVRPAHRVYGIGAVARLAQVSTRTLRHYDDLGLLKPAWVDPPTGYRWYTPAQIHRLHRILVLRDLGVQLSDIGRVLDEEMSVEQLREQAT